MCGLYHLGIGAGGGGGGNVGVIIAVGVAVFVGFFAVGIVVVCAVVLEEECLFPRAVERRAAGGVSGEAGVHVLHVLPPHAVEALPCSGVGVWNNEGIPSHFTPIVAEGRKCKWT